MLFVLSLSPVSPRPLYFLFGKHDWVYYVIYMIILLCCLQDKEGDSGKKSSDLLAVPTSEHLVYDLSLFMGNLFVILHFYLVKIYQVSESLTFQSVSVSAWLFFFSLSLSAIHREHYGIRAQRTFSVSVISHHGTLRYSMSEIVTSPVQIWQWDSKSVILTLKQSCY